MHPATQPFHLFPNTPAGCSHTHRNRHPAIICPQISPPEALFNLSATDVGCVVSTHRSQRSKT